LDAVLLSTIDYVEDTDKPKPGQIIEYDDVPDSSFYSFDW
jgi:hypothetical protein